MHLHGSSSSSCHVCFVCASFHPHVIHDCLTADWHLDCTRVDPFWLSSFDKNEKMKRRGKPRSCFSVGSSLGRQLSTRQKHDQGCWASNLTLGVHWVLDPRHGHRTHSNHEVSSRTEESFRNVLFTRLPDRTKASVRSQGGPGAGLALTTCPTCLVTRLEPQLFRVLLLRRFRLPLPHCAFLPVW